MALQHVHAMFILTIYSAVFTTILKFIWLQEPVLLKGTLRMNLDPTNIYTDAQIWCALEQVTVLLRIS